MWGIWSGSLLISAGKTKALEWPGAQFASHAGGGWKISVIIQVSACSVFHCIQSHYVLYCYESAPFYCFDNEVAPRSIIASMATYANGVITSRLLQRSTWSIYFEKMSSLHWKSGVRRSAFTQGRACQLRRCKLWKFVSPNNPGVSVYAPTRIFYSLFDIGHGNLVVLTSSSPFSFG